MSRTKTTKTKSQNLSVADIISTAPSFRPESLILSDIKWKYLVRSVLRGQNLMITGPAGSGKTLAVRTVADAMDRPFFYFNLGSTQDPRTALIGTTHFDKESGTYFNQSTFIKAIQIPDAVILLDEFLKAKAICTELDVLYLSVLKHSPSSATTLRQFTRGLGCSRC